MKIDSEGLSRWPLLLAGSTLAVLGIGLEVTDESVAIAVACWTLAAACIGAFLYAEGARHREWLDGRDTPEPGPRPPDRVSSPATDTRTNAHDAP